MFRTRFGLSLLTALSALGLCGCSSKPDYGLVSGQVKVNGKPAEKVRVEFHPDAQNGTTGASSFATTDSEGRYTLAHADGPGAVLGTHKVVLNDLRFAESETGRGIPIRFGPDYNSIMKTPLERKVEPGEQTIDIAIDTK